MYASMGWRAGKARTCLPKIIYAKRNDGIREPENVSAERGGTYDELALPGKIAVTDTDEGVVVLALAERRGVDVGREEADGGEDALVEGGLVGVGERSSYPAI